MRRMAFLYLSRPENQKYTYIKYLLDALQEVAEKVTVIKGKDSYYNKDGVLPSSANAYFMAMMEVGKAALEKYDEVICVDDSFFGPFCGFGLILKEMECRKCDYWFLCVQPEMEQQGERIEESVEEGILIFRRGMLNEDRFWKVIEKRTDVRIFYRKMKEGGWRGEALFPCAWKKEKAIQNYKNYDYRMLEMIRGGYPILPCSKFSENVNLVHDMPEILEYIEKDTPYQIDAVWEYILENCEIGTLCKCLKADYILPAQQCASQALVKTEVLVIAHFYYEECLEEMFGYLSDIPEWIDLCLTSSKDSVIKKLEELTVSLKNKVLIRKVGNRGRDIGALLVGCRDLVMHYSYICFIRVKNTLSGQPANIWEIFRMNMWENNLKSAFYVMNILNLFAQNPRLGLLVPPIPKNDLYRKLLLNGWSGTFDETLKLLERLKIKVPLTEQDQPISFSTSFWCRREALQPLFEYGFEEKDFPEEPLPPTGTISHAIERALPYIAQSVGYYTGIVECDEYASMEIILLSDIVGELLNEKEKLCIYNKRLREQIDEFGAYNSELKQKAEILTNQFQVQKEKANLYGKRNRELKEKLDQSGKRNGELKEKLDQSGKRNGELKEKLDQSGKRNGELKEKLDRFGKRNGELKEKLDQFGKRNQELKEKLLGSNI